MGTRKHSFQMCRIMATIAGQLIITASHGGVMFLCTYCPGRHRSSRCFFTSVRLRALDMLAAGSTATARIGRYKLSSKRGISRFYNVARVVPHFTKTTHIMCDKSCLNA